MPSFHSMVSGTQSSSSSSISAHLASFPSPSACKRVARCMPYCCFSSSSVNCLGAVGGAAREWCHCESYNHRETRAYVCSGSTPGLDRVQLQFRSSLENSLIWVLMFAGRLQFWRRVEVEVLEKLYFRNLP